MTHNQLPIIAAIANYNMADELDRLLPTLLEQGYHAIFVLDDASTDNSKHTVERFGTTVTFVNGKTNKGAGGNRNRILKAIDYDAIIHFLDADVILETENVAEQIRVTLPNEPFGFIVGLTKTSKGLQNAWNYGPRIGLRSDIGAWVQASLIEALITSHPRRAAHLRRWFRPLLVGWPDLTKTPTRCPVYWGIEQNLIIRSDVFAKLHGFDENLRETEILELAIRMHRQQLKSYFDPRIVIRHTEGDVRKYNRNNVKMKELFKINRQYGLLNWVLSKDTFNTHD